MTATLRADTVAQLKTQAQALAPGMTATRRDLHRHPERRLRLPRTQRVVLDALAPLPVELQVGTGLDSVIGVLRGDPAGPTVLLRADMDALPVTEESGEEFSSENDLMHACGHDLHTAALIGAAHLLSSVQDLPGDVVLMFQPGEEDPGGATIMLAEGVLEASGRRVDAAYGLHVTTAQHGLFRTRPGALMAGVANLHITVTGLGGHGSSPHLAVDPVAAAAEIVLALQAFVTRRVYVFDPVVVNIGHLRAGGPINAIPESAYLGGSVRTFSDTSWALLRSQLPPFVRQIAAAHGCTADVRLELSCPATVNDAASTATVLADLTAAFGPERVEHMDQPASISEDFSYVLEEVPGTFILLGACPPDLDPAGAPANHSSKVRFDDSVLPDQAVALAAMALGGLHRLADGDGA
ncbi:MAG TPA: M20 family metallopeptidase [Cellulomonas sp.]